MEPHSASRSRQRVPILQCLCRRIKAKDECRRTAQQEAHEPEMSRKGLGLCEGVGDLQSRPQDGHKGKGQCSGSDRSKVLQTSQSRRGKTQLSRRKRSDLICSLGRSLCFNWQLCRQQRQMKMRELNNNSINQSTVNIPLTTLLLEGRYFSTHPIIAFFLILQSKLSTISFSRWFLLPPGICSSAESQRPEWHTMQLIHFLPLSTPNNQRTGSFRKGQTGGGVNCSFKSLFPHLVYSVVLSYIAFFSVYKLDSCTIVLCYPDSQYSNSLIFQLRN